MDGWMDGWMGELAAPARASSIPRFGKNPVVAGPLPAPPQEAVNREAEDKKAAAAAQPTAFDPAPKPPRHDEFPEITDTDRIYQKNEGRWDTRGGPGAGEGEAEGRWEAGA
jgi:hypothetical protein